MTWFDCEMSPGSPSKKNQKETMYYPLSCPSKLGLASFRLSFTFFSLFLSSFSTSLSCVWVCVTGRVCEGGLLRKPPLKCAYVNSARNYIFMRDTSLRRSSVATVRVCAHCTVGTARRDVFRAEVSFFMRDSRVTCVRWDGPGPTPIPTVNPGFLTGFPY